MTTVVVTRCAGGGHIIIAVSDGSIIALDTDDVIGQRKAALLQLTPRDAYLVLDIRQAIKAAGAVTFAQAKTAAEAETYTLLGE